MADGALVLLSRAEAYEAINDHESAASVSSQRDFEVIDVWVPALSLRIDELCGPVVIRTVTDERHDGGVFVIALRKSPASSVTSVTEYDVGVATVLTAEMDATLPADGYVRERLGQVTFINRRSSGYDYPFPHGRQNVKVTYEAGRHDTTAAVDAKFKMAASAILRRLWSREAGAWARGGNPFEADGMPPGFFKAVDPMVQEFLSDEMRPPGMA